MGKMRSFAENYKPKTEKVYLPLYTLPFCPECEAKLNALTESVFSGYKNWPNCVIGFLPEKANHLRPSQYIQERKPWLGYSKNESTQEARVALKLSPNPQE